MKTTIDGKFSIEAELDGVEVETLAGILHERITKHREEAMLDHACKLITQAELDWHLSHADYTEGIARKLFPDWAGSK